MTQARFYSAILARDFVVGGNATITIVSQKTAVRYTYRIRKAKDGNVFFVSLLTGSDNESSYTYIGIVKNEQFQLTTKSKLPANSPAVKGIQWVLSHLFSCSLPDQVEVWHEGRCGRCHRKLTVPQSIESGFGPECVKHR